MLNGGTMKWFLVCVCVWYLCAHRRSKYFKIVSDWFTLLADLYGLSLIML